MSSSPEQSKKTIILLFDGASNNFTKHPTNVLRLFTLLDRNADKQKLYYQPGLGTYAAKGNAWHPRIKYLQEMLDSMLDWYLDTHVIDGYRFLMEHYSPGDHVCMFGFGRGAYTARCLAGMLNKVGLLLPDNDQMVASAYERYLDTSPDGKELARDFKRRLGRHLSIDFLGLWDTVSSGGLITSRHLPFSACNSAVKTVRHALALDERRVKFRHTPWYGTARQEGVEPPSFLREGVSIMVQPIPILSSLLQLPPRPEDIEDVDDQSQCHLTDVKEVWFAGCHSDVGGGHGDHDPLNTLSDPSLYWMINQVLGSGVPLRFSIEALSKLEGFKYTRANTLQASTKPVSSALQRVEQRDVGLNARSCIHDELESNWFWWVPEYLPFRNSSFDRAGNVWREIRLPNRGRGRKIWEADVLVHESVKLRMQEGSYKPMATFERKNPLVQYVNDSGENLGEGRVVRGRLGLGRVRGANRRRSSEEEEVPQQMSRRSFWLSVAAFCVVVPLAIYAT